MKSFLLALCLFATPVFGQFGEPKDLPIDKLPKGIASEAGKVTLFADFSGPRNEGAISVYLINRSDQEIDLNAQDGDVYLKLETKTASGEWVRAQPHRYSWCGNSYFSGPKVRVGHFYHIEGYQPTKGEKAVIRFRLYGQPGYEIASQEAEGLVRASDIENASSDAMTVKTGSFDFLAEVATGKRKLVNRMDHLANLQEYAIHELERRFRPEKTAPVLEEVYRKFPELKPKPAE